jgi:methyl-accepting chemotaxis protein
MVGAAEHGEVVDDDGARLAVPLAPRLPAGRADGEPVLTVFAGTVVEEVADDKLDLVRAIGLWVIAVVLVLALSQIAVGYITGRTRRVVKQLDQRTVTIERAVNHVSPGSPPLIDRVIAHGERMSALESQMKALQEGLSTLHRTVETVDVRIKTIGDHVYETEHNARSANDKVSQHGTRVEQFGAKVEQALSRLAAVESNQAYAATQMASVTETTQKVEHWLRGHATGKIKERDSDDTPEVT